MRILNSNEISFVSGAESSDKEWLTVSSNSDIFWSAFSASAGIGAGAFLSLPIALGVVVYSVAYYGVYTPVYYAVDGIVTAVSGIGSGVYNGGAYVYNSIVG